MSAKTSPLIVKVKKELPSDEIKDFAETAMNELLGWYGYENVDRTDLGRCSGALAMGAHKNAPTTITLRPNSRMRASMATTTPTMPANTASSPDTAPTRAAPPVPQTGATPEPPGGHPNDSSPESSGRYSKSPAGVSVGSSSMVATDEKKDVECGWCKRPVSLSSPDFLTSPEGPRYCTESCFSQSRRASFKRAKTCDWCKHVRHAVSYVDFQDGASQLQFCSDKCLNQYKMQIFCKETQAHLDMNPHLLEKGDAKSEGALITPDLWLKNCKSRSISPLSDRSRSRSPVRPHKPIITLAPSSKLLSRPAIPAVPTIAPRISPRAARKRRPHRPAALNRNEPTHMNAIKPSASATTSLQDLTTNAQLRNISNHTLQTIQKDILQKANNTNHQFLPPPPNLYPLRSPTGNSPALRFPANATPQPSSGPSIPPPNVHPPGSSFQPTPTDPATHTNPNPSGTAPHTVPSMFGSSPPPITILVPYPIMVPVPFPVPIPMPILAFLRAAQVQLDAKNKTANGPPATSEPSTETPTTHEQPLDFTTTRDLCDDDDPEQLIEVVCEDSSDMPPDDDSCEELPAPAQPNHTPITQTTINAPAEPPQQPLPKIKITRLNSRRGVITANTATPPAAHTTPPEAPVTAGRSLGSSLVVAPAKESPPPILETSRPLRKRKRLVDCDYNRVREDDTKKKPA